MFYSQYEEDVLIRDFFKNKEKGVLIDVGAADGIRYSNSRHFITELGWRGTLVEPHPNYFESLRSLYADSKDITLLQCAVGAEAGKAPFYLFGRDEHAQVSTLSSDFKDRVISVHGNKYEAEPLIVDVLTLEDILSKTEHVDFLSIDCEGIDMLVLQSNDWQLYRPKLVCVEHSMPMHELHNFMISANYNFLTSTIGNSIFYRV